MNPQLRKKARLIRRIPTGTPLLLYPERALELNESACEIIELCDGTHSLDQIVALVRERHPKDAPETIRAGVTRVIDELAKRALLEVSP
jgi:coenzyme PQQ biosynthesis protein PqqD